jgi:phosphate transport system substrate-binding protein
VIVTVAACGTDDNSSTTTESTTTGTVSPAGAPAGSGSADAGEGASAPGSADGAPDSSSDGASAPAGSTAVTQALTFDSAGFTCATGTLRSSGSTAQGKAMAELITSYNAKCGATVNDYGGGGSGQGVTDFLAHQTDFGGSDSAMDAEQLAQAKTERCEGSDAINLPMVTGPIAVAYHLTGVDTLVLTPEVLSGIFGGSITKWNDEKIAALNDGVALPDLAITSVHRSEDSGTTDNFTRYLAAAGGWTFEGGKAWTAPGGTGAQGSDGVSKAVASTEGAIGYVEWGYAQQDMLAMAEIDNGAGPVALTAGSVGAAVQAAKITGTGGDLALTLDYATQAPGAYPVILVTYELVCTGGNGDATDLLRSFLGYAATDGQATFVDLGAAPLPTDIQTKVVDAVKALG